ncbi:MAG: hypothetical protein DRI48_05995 [Chloroflexi bacterium]|nr:MAG: hypothetical protein DRI48_05995 [Chloroflexota bacterium]
MSSTAIQSLIGTALIDRKFCQELLNGKRATILAEFDLTTEERNVALEINAETIHEFAVALYRRLTTTQ